MLTRINLPNPRPESWKKDNLIESKIKKKYEAHFLINKVLKDKIEKKN